MQDINISNVTSRYPRGVMKPKILIEDNMDIDYNITEEDKSGRLNANFADEFDEESIAFILRKKETKKTVPGKNDSTILKDFEGIKFETKSDKEDHDETTRINRNILEVIKMEIQTLDKNDF